MFGREMDDFLSLRCSFVWIVIFTNVGFIINFWKTGRRARAPTAITEDRSLVSRPCSS